MGILIRLIATGAALTALALPALGGGDDYDALNDEEGKGPVYYGFVRDNRGSPVADARVVLQPKTGEPMVLKSNVLGLYRSHVSKGVVPDDITVSCDKNGFKQVKVARRNPPGATDMNIETNCTMQRL
jgi:hypothetical protein